MTTATVRRECVSDSDMGRATFMEDELFRAAVKGDASVLSEGNIAKHDDEYYKDQTTPRKNNIIHVAAENGRAEFIEVALARFLELSDRKNDNGDTPFHVAARKGYDEIVRIFVSCEVCATKDESEVKEDWPWMAKKLQGDTPLHLALSSNKLRVAMDLLQVGSLVVLSLINASQETPLSHFSQILYRHFRIPCSSFSSPFFYGLSGKQKYILMQENYSMRLTVKPILKKVMNF